MATYLLDTDTLIDFSKAREPTRTQILAWIAGGHQLGTCAIVVAEFYAGTAPADRPVWDRFLRLLSYWDISLSAALQAGVWRYDYARHGIQLHTTDTLIAAVALEQGATIVTNNTKDFPMGGVQLLSLRP